MFRKAQTPITVVALILSVAAIVLAGFSLSKAGDAKIDDTEFMAKVEKGIEGYIEKQMAAQAGGGNTSEPVDVSVDDDAAMGDESAKVTIVEFSDFECPYCARFHKDTLPQLESDYIDKGKVRFVYRDFPLSFHKDSKEASMAAECARKQGGDKLFFKYHDTLYENQASFGTDNFKKWAADLGLNTSEFDDCLDNKTTESEVDKDFSDGSSYGVSGTPAFFVNGRIVTGAQPFSVFKTLIDEELAK